MTVSTTTSRVEYAGNGSTTAFSVPFYFLASGDLKVYKGGTLQTLTTHYTVSGAGNPAGGTVTFLAAPAVGQDVVIFRDPALTQGTDYVANDPFPAESHERALDRLTMIAQRNRDLLGRSFVLPDGVTGVSTTLPTPEADKVVAWNSTGTALQNRSATDFATALTYADRRVETFTGNGSTVDFVLTDTPAVIANTDVDIEGVSQVPGVDYTLLADGVTIRFDVAPANGLTICVKYGQAVAQGQNDANIVTYSAAGAGAVARTMQAKARDVVSVQDFGAVGDGAADDTAKCQAAIDAVYAAGGGRVIFPGGKTYLVGEVSYAGISVGVASLVIKDNVTLQIDGTIKVKNSAYGVGAFYGAIRSLDAGVSNAAIEGVGTIDGNKANQIASTQCSNIFLYATANVRVEGIRSINANGQAIQVVGKTATYATNIIIRDNIVDGASYIGIQSSQFDGLVITGNIVKNTTDNAIDIYGEDGTVTCHGKNFTISGNVVDTCQCGVFLETVRDGVTTGNSITGCSYGILVNRINGQPRNLMVSGNAIKSCPVGIRVTGDTGGMRISENTIDLFSTSGIQLGNGATGSVSYIDVSNNYLTPSTNTTPCISVQGSTASFLKGKFNTITAASITSAYILSITALTPFQVLIDSFTILPYQVGPEFGESGTFTPTLTCATPGNLSVTYGGASNQVGRYTRIGNVVFYQIFLGTTAFTHTTASGNVRIGGLPYTVLNATQNAAPGAMTVSGLTKAGYTNFVAIPNLNNTYLQISASGSAVANAAVQITDLPTGGTPNFYISGFYFI